ncbi:MAG: pyridoxamine 5'-phosphate oxidase family protein [Candidatus Methanomethylicia archaeon]
MSTEEMNWEEIEQLLTCARVGRLGVVTEDGKPYVVPIGYVYSNGEIFFHTCSKGLKMDSIRRKPYVCFEVDEALPDISMYKSIVVFGTIRIIEDRSEMIPYLQKLINKYRVPQEFNKYMSKPGRNIEAELEAVRICVITPIQVTGRKFVRRF